MEEKNVVQMLRETAQNTYTLLMAMAAHVEKLELENADMKRRLSDDLK